jgi:hypothetical protein
MKWGLTSLGAALAVATALALVPVGGSSGQTGDRTITLFGDENGGTYGFVDNPPRSPASDPTSPKARFSMGDQGYWTGIIRDRKGGRRAGTVFGTETVRSSSNMRSTRAGKRSRQPSSAGPARMRAQREHFSSRPPGAATSTRSPSCGEYVDASQAEPVEIGVRQPVWKLRAPR